MGVIFVFLMELFSLEIGSQVVHAGSPVVALERQVYVLTNILTADLRPAMFDWCQNYLAVCW